MTKKVPDAAVILGRRYRDALVFAVQAAREAEQQFGLESSEYHAAAAQQDEAVRTAREFNASLRSVLQKADRATRGTKIDAKQPKAKPPRKPCPTCSRMVVSTKLGLLAAHNPTKKSTSWCKGGQRPKPDYVDAMERLSFYKIRS